MHFSFLLKNIMLDSAAHFLSNRRNNVHGTLPENTVHFILSSRQIKKLHMIEFIELILSNSLCCTTFRARKRNSSRELNIYLSWGCLHTLLHGPPFFEDPLVPKIRKIFSLLIHSRTVSCSLVFYWALFWVLKIQ